MTRRRHLLTLAAAVAVAASLVPGAPAAAAEPYTYPVRPGDAKWATFATHQEMEQATQLPDKLVKSMSTARLAATVLAYPLLMDAIAFNNVQEGFETVASRFNGLQELLQRPDSGEALLALYRKHNTSGPDAGKAAWQSWAHEILLAQPQVLNTFTAEGLENLLTASRKKYSVKQAEPDIHGQAGLEHTAVLLGRALVTKEGWDYKQSRLLREAFAPRADAAVLEVGPGTRDVPRLQLQPVQLFHHQQVLPLTRHEPVGAIALTGFASSTMDGYFPLIETTSTTNTRVSFGAMPALELPCGP